MRKIKIFGIKIFEEKHLGYKVRYNVLGVHVNASPYLYLKRFLKEELTLKRNKEIENIVFLFNNTGESSFLLASFNLQNDYFLSKTLFVGTKPYHLQLKQLYCPLGSFIYRPELCWVHLKWEKGNFFKFNGVNIYLSATLRYFSNFEKQVLNEENTDKVKHFFINFFGQNPQYILPKAYKLYLSKKSIKWVTIKKNLSYVKRPFIYVCNESSSNERLPFEFWQLLTHRLQLKGYDVIFNETFNSPDSSFGHSFYTTLPEALYLAKKAKCVVGLRSGFLDLAAPISQNIVAIYTNFIYRVKELPAMPACKVKAAFSLEKLPQKPKNILELVIDDKSNFCHEYIVNTIVNYIFKSCEIKSLTPPMCN